jgi:hypothetical protein
MSDEHQKWINSAVGSERVIPQFIYNVADYKYDRVMSFCPLSAGDQISITLSDGEKLLNKTIKRVFHSDAPLHVGHQVVESFIELED